MRMADYVVPTTLATSADLAAWTGQAAPANADALLRACTRLVLEQTRTASYDSDPTTGLPTDPNITAALKDATCIQAAGWIVLNIDPLAGGINTGGVKKSTKLLSGSIELAGAEQTAAAKVYAVANLVPDAVRRLRQQNLLSMFTSHS